MPTLPDGREVDSSSAEWREECLRAWKAKQPEVDRHVATLLRMTGAGSRDQRAAYIASLQQREDEGFAQRVKAEFLAAWEKRAAKP